MIDFSVVIPTYNGKGTLPTVLRGLERQQNHLRFEVIVVDDGSTDNTASILEKTDWDLELHTVRQDNRGPAAARNTGVESAHGKFIALLGDDTIPKPAWLQAHALSHRIYEESQPLAVLGLTELHPRIRSTPFLDWIYQEGLQFGYTLIEDPDDVDFNFFYSSNISVARQTMIDHPFDPGFPFAAWEDIELGYRLKSKGLRIVLNEQALAYHDHPTSLRNFSKRQETAGYSAVLFYQRHPELAGFVGIDPEQIPMPRDRFSELRRALAGYYFEARSISRPDLWKAILRDRYRLGIERAWREASAFENSQKSAT